MVGVPAVEVRLRPKGGLLRARFSAVGNSVDNKNYPPSYASIGS
jgi:hypothetical protein